jgi:CRISPR-associated endoribonuclease Cas6
MGKHGIPKPWVLTLDRSRQDLVVRITLFGFAMEWAGAVAHALATALQHGIEWKERAPGIFLPKPVVGQLDIKASDHGLLPRRRQTASLDFVTPLDAAGDDPLDRPATVIGRLARRIDLLARWMDVEIDADWPTLAASWNDLDFQTGGFARAPPLDRKSGRGQHRFQVRLMAGSLGLGGELDPFWPLLVLGQSSHVGRGATAGLGRYVLG